MSGRKQIKIGAGVLLILWVITLLVGVMVKAQDKNLPLPLEDKCVKVYANLGWTNELENKLNEIDATGEWTIATQGNGAAAVIVRLKKCRLSGK